jgi:hypothetical protein
MRLSWVTVTQLRSHGQPPSFTPKRADNSRTESTDSPRLEAACLRDVLPATAGNCREVPGKWWAL